ncbi:stage V sporulation protein AE [Clostridium frigidicarnis]|uniref:Stage V sporulation protein AE n=2 Tax=Clostridium frigidicarnis TaxID=84698 RepID=A0A1I0VG97_9CLOT|nr:stage V sporulation protein AE [Clostridium frigidicarnis]
MMSYVNAFLFGGTMCVIAQILMDRTKLTPARILVAFVTLGTILGGLGLYDKLIVIGKAGATVPLPGFGNALAKSAIKEVDKIGIVGAFTGGIKGTAAGITAAIFFGYIMAIVSNPKTKN